MTRVTIFRSAADAASAHHAARSVVGQAGPLPPTLHDVEAEQQTVASKAKQIDAQFASCVQSGKMKPDDPTLAQWRAQKERADAYAAQDFSLWGTGALGWLFVTPDDLDRGYQLERELQPWFDVANNCGGKAPVPSGDQLQKQQQNDFGLGDLFKGVQGLVLLLVAYEFLKGRNSGG
jgi:hypothetical protein